MAISLETKMRFERRALGLCALALLVGTVLLSSFHSSNVEPSEMRSLFERLTSGTPFARELQTTYDSSSLVVLPRYAYMFGDVWEPVRKSDIPFFFYAGKAGGLIFQQICAECLGLVSASSRGDATGDTLEVRTRPSDQGKYLNVDLGTRAGIDKARNLGLAKSGLVEIAFSQHLVYSTKLFSTTHVGRGMVMFRNPVKREMDLFYYQQRAAWVGPQEYDATLGGMSLLEFSKSKKVVENFMVRSLANLPDTMDVTTEHIAIAKEVLRRKFIVGVMEWFDLSISRFERFFGWWDSSHVWDDRTVNNCHYTKISKGDHIGKS